MKNKRINILPIIISIIVFASILSAQNGYLAKIGNEKISPNEFIKRFELTPKVTVNFPEDSSKIYFLYSLIAEKLWALEGEKLGLQNSGYVKKSTDNLLEKLLSDKLYKEEIEKKIKVFPSEINQDLVKIHIKLIMNFISSSSKNEINEIYSELQNGVDFDSLLSTRNEAAEQKEGIPILYGDMSPELENRVFKLNPDENTKPVFVGGAWVIYHLAKREYIKTHPNFPGKSDEKIAEEVIFDRKAKVNYRKFFRHNIMGHEVKTDKKLFNKLDNALYSRLGENLQNAFNPNDNKYYMNYYQILSVKKDFSKEELNGLFIKFKNNPVSLVKFIDEVAVDGLSVAKSDEISFYNMLSARVKKYIFDKLLVRLAYKRGLQNDEELKKELKEWQESFIASYYRNSFLKKISVENKEVNNYYLKIKDLIPDSLRNNYDYIKERIGSGLYFKKLSELYELKTAELAVKYGVEINRKMLDKLHVTNVQMIVYRSLGFGGSITAVPYLTPFYKWYSWMPKELRTKGEK